MVDETQDLQKEVIQVTSLDQLAAQKVILEIELVDSVLRIPARTLTYAQWIACAREIPMPTPPDFAGPKGIIYNREDPAYTRAVDEWNDKVGMLRLLKCLDIPIEGNTQEEKLATLNSKLGAQVTLAIVNGLTRAHRGGFARIQSRADTFQSNGVSSPSDMPEAGLADSTI